MAHEIRPAARARADDDIDLLRQLEQRRLPGARPPGLMQDVRPLALDEKERARFFKRIMGCFIVAVRVGDAGDGRGRAAHRMVGEGSRFLLMASGTGMGTDVLHLGAHITVWRVVRDKRNLIGRI